MDRPQQTPTRRKPARAVVIVRPHPKQNTVDVLADIFGGEGFAETIGAEGINTLSGVVLKFDLSTEFDQVASARIRRMLAPSLN